MLFVLLNSLLLLPTSSGALFCQSCLTVTTNRNKKLEYDIDGKEGSCKLTRCSEEYDQCYYTTFLYKNSQIEIHQCGITTMTNDEVCSNLQLGSDEVFCSVARCATGRCDVTYLLTSDPEPPANSFPKGLDLAQETVQQPESTVQQPQNTVQGPKSPKIQNIVQQPKVQNNIQPKMQQDATDDVTDDLIDDISDDIDNDVIDHSDDVNIEDDVTEDSADDVTNDVTVEEVEKVNDNDAIIKVAQPEPKPEGYKAGAESGAVRCVHSSFALVLVLGVLN